MSEKVRNRGRMAIYSMAGFYLLYMAYKFRFTGQQRKYQNPDDCVYGILCSGGRRNADWRDYRRI